MEEHIPEFRSLCPRPPRDRHRLTFPSAAGCLRPWDGQPPREPAWCAPPPWSLAAVASDRHLHSCCLSPPLRREFRVSPGARAAQVRRLSLPVGWRWRWWGVASRPHPCPRVILLPLPPPGWLVWVPFAGAFFPRLRWHKVPVGDLVPLFLPRAPADPAAPVGTPAALLYAGFSG